MGHLRLRENKWLVQGCKGRSWIGDLKAHLGSASFLGWAPRRPFSQELLPRKVLPGPFLPRTWTKDPGFIMEGGESAYLGLLGSVFNLRSSKRSHENDRIKMFEYPGDQASFRRYFPLPCDFPQSFFFPSILRGYVYKAHTWQVVPWGRMQR